MNEEERGEMSIDYSYNTGSEERTEVLEGLSIDCGNSVTRLTHQEEEEALINPNW